MLQGSIFRLRRAIDHSTQVWKQIMTTFINSDMGAGTVIHKYNKFFDFINLRMGWISKRWWRLYKCLSCTQEPSPIFSSCPFNTPLKLWYCIKSCKCVQEKNSSTDFLSKEICIYVYWLPSRILPFSKFKSTVHPHLNPKKHTVQR